MKPNDEIYGDYQQKQQTVSGQIEQVVIHPLEAGAVAEKPTNKDVGKYGYDLWQSQEHKRWYASYEADKGTVWLMWCRDHFKQIERRHVPDDLASDGV